MPARFHQWVRREINRLAKVFAERADDDPAIQAVYPLVAHAADEMNAAWASYRRVCARAADESECQMARFVERYRPVVILLIPGALNELEELPPCGGVDLAMIAEHLLALVESEPSEAKLAYAMRAELTAAREGALVGSSSPEESARYTLSDAAQRASIVITHAVELYRGTVSGASELYAEFAADLPNNQDVVKTRESGFQTRAAAE